MENLLNRKDFLAVLPMLKREIVEVPEWVEGASVHVRELTGAERDRMLYLHGDEKIGDAELVIEIAILVACDADGRPVFDVEDKVQLMGRSYLPARRIYRKSMELSGIKLEKKDDPVGEAGKDSGAEESGGSGSN